jgi:hypothetical protein
MRPLALLRRTNEREMEQHEQPFDFLQPRAFQVPCSFLQLTRALRYAWLAERNNKHDRLQDPIRLLMDGIEQARYGRSKDSVQAIKEAYKVLAEVQ